MKIDRIGKPGWVLLVAVVFVVLGGLPGTANAFEDDGPPPGDRKEAGEGRGGGHPGWAGHGRRGRWREHGGHGGREGPGGGPMTTADIDELLDVLKDYHPELAERVREVAAKDPGRVREVLGEHGPRLHRLVMIKKYNPELYALMTEDQQLSRESDELAGRLRGVRDEDERAQVRDQLQHVVEHHFEVRQQMRERRLARLTQRIEQLREQIEARAESKQELIGQRLAELTGDPGQARW